MMETRREFLKKSAVLGGMAAALPGAGIEAVSGPGTVSSGEGKPRRVIFLVSDGMSLGVPSLAEEFSRMVRGKGTHLAALMADRSVAHGFFETHSLNSLVTDSAAAASAWGSGTRVFNGSINVLPDGTELTPICRLVKRAGFGTGLVTTATVTHATPAGFAANQGNRGDEGAIAPQYLDVVDVVMGGGREYFDGSLRKDGTDVIGKYKSSGYTDVYTKAELASAPGAERLLGLFGKGHLPYSIDHLNDESMKAGIPTLAEMASAALAVLERNPNGFLLQVEGARIDHAAHANDAGAILWDQLAFDDALGVALDFAKAHPETLVIVTSDHGNSNPGLNGLGNSYAKSTQSFERLKLAKGSFGTVRERLGALGAADHAAAVALVAELLGVTVSEAEIKLIRRAIAGEPVECLNAQHASWVGVMGEIAGNYHGVWWTSTSHTQDYTLIEAVGPGQDAFNGLLKNFQAFGLLTGIFGISHVNATMSPDDARKYLSAAPRIGRSDWA